MLKADFHLHTHEDIVDSWLVKYSAKDLIRLAAKQKFQVLSITNHEKVFFNQEIKGFARKKGILLIPGAEPRIEGADVLIINATNDELARIKRLDDLERIKDSALIIAPHPYFIFGCSLGDKLVRHMDSFNAIEFSHIHAMPLFNPFFNLIIGNKKAAETAKEYHKPLVGTSDAHKLYELGFTFTRVDAAKNKDAVIDAVKRNKIRMENNPMPTSLFFRRISGAFLKEVAMKRVLQNNHRQAKERLACKRFK